MKMPFVCWGLENEKKRMDEIKREGEKNYEEKKPNNNHDERGFGYKE